MERLIRHLGLLMSLDACSMSARHVEFRDRGNQGAPKAVANDVAYGAPWREQCNTLPTLGTRAQSLMLYSGSAVGQCDAPSTLPGFTQPSSNSETCRHAHSYDEF